MTEDDLAALDLFGLSPPTCPAEELAAFVAELFRDAERGELLFNHREGECFATSWHGLDVAALTAAARTRAAGDVWIPIGSRRQRLPAPRRGGNAEVLDVFALAVDLDVHCPWHDRDDLPPTIADAYQLLADFPLAPSVVVATGGGLQAWWLAAEPWEASTAEPVLGRWGANWRELGRRRGWHVDSTATLEHVFRLPGTTNVRAGAVVQVLEADWRRYGLDDLDEHLVEEQTPPRPPIEPRQRRNGEQLAGDRYNASTDVGTLLEAHGFVLSHNTRSGERHYFAPHRARSRERCGATVYSDGHAAVWSTTFASANNIDAAFGYDAFGLFARLKHGGDFTAAARAAAATERTGDDQPIDPDTGERAEAVPSGLAAIALPPELWDAHPALKQIRDAAHSRGRAPAAVLACVLTRLCAEVDAVYVLPPIVGGIGSLNLAAAVVAPSGSGKSSSDAVAGELLRTEGGPTDTRPADLPLGSGEGIAEAYMGSRPATEDEKGAGVAINGRIRQQTRFRNRFIGDEGEAVMAQRKRQGATLMPTLRTLVTGGALGQQNAAADNRRIIGEHRYRAAVLLGFQTATAAALLDDAPGGTPQRFAYFAAIDATVPAPADRPTWPGELVVELPAARWREQRPRARGERRTIPVDEAVRQQVMADDHARQTGSAQGDTLDGHRNLVRLKIAALLGLLLGELAVTEETWRLAGIVMDHSDAVRGHVLAHQADEARRAEQNRTNVHVSRAVATHETIGDRATEAMARAMARRAHRVERPSSRNELVKACKSADRREGSVDESIELALRRGWIALVGDHFEPGASQPA